MALIAPDRRVKILNMALSGEKGQSLCLMFLCAFRTIGCVICGSMPVSVKRWQQLWAQLRVRWPSTDICFRPKLGFKA